MYDTKQRNPVIAWILYLQFIEIEVQAERAQIPSKPCRCPGQTVALHQRGGRLTVKRRPPAGAFPGGVLLAQASMVRASGRGSGRAMSPSPDSLVGKHGSRIRTWIRTG